MLDHVGVRVSDFERSKRFYEEALSPLGYELIWIGQGEPGDPIHVAFSAADRATVKAFHEAALAAGGRDNGRPGLRPEYHPSYYAAFVLDPDGNNIEAVCHRSGEEA
jgi:catechol 2,3-dioxygenase-like lactoylglutathione lyase family enzyme